MKSEPDVYSIDDMSRDGTGFWEGVRNYQARGFMRDMVAADLALFYHSSTKPPGVAGIIEIVGEARPDPTQFDEGSSYYDPKSKPEDPRWSVVDVKFVEKFPALLPLQALKDEPALANMLAVQKGSRLSVQPVDKADFERVLEMAGAKTKVR